MTRAKFGSRCFKCGDVIKPLQEARHDLKTLQLFCYPSCRKDQEATPKPAECLWQGRDAWGMEWPCWRHWYRNDYVPRFCDPCRSCTPLIDLADYWVAQYAERKERLDRMWRLG